MPFMSKYLNMLIIHLDVAMASKEKVTAWSQHK
jgi:hypothetical protein